MPIPSHGPEAFLPYIFESQRVGHNPVMARKGVRVNSTIPLAWSAGPEGMLCIDKSVPGRHKSVLKSGLSHL